MTDPISSAADRLGSAFRAYGEGVYKTGRLSRADYLSSMKSALGADDLYESFRSLVNSGFDYMATIHEIRKQRDKDIRRRR